MAATTSVNASRGIRRGFRARLTSLAGAVALTATALSSSVALAPAASAVTPSVATAITTGGSHACAVTSSGGVKCWGSNSGGRLGNGTTTDSLTPVDVVNASGGLLSGVSAISARPSSIHTCALMSSGGVKCWGYSNRGQLGNGTTTASSTPVDVVDASGGLLSGVTAIATGHFHSCALMTSGGVKCWGYNTDGQLGDGTTIDRSTPVDVVDPAGGLLSGVTAISAGWDATCALTTSGGVKCWGRNVEGQLGDGTWTSSATAVDVAGLTSGVASISAGNRHTCAVTSGGGAMCWGSNSDGQVGNATTVNASAPVGVSGLSSGVASIAAGGGHTCAVTTSGGARCWGNNNNGQLGAGAGIGSETCTVPGFPTTSCSSTPVDVSGLTGVTAVSTGLGFSCAITTVSGSKCWGYNSDGQLGNGSTTSSSVPVGVSGFPNYVPVASFTTSCSGVVCTFTDTSADVDGAISGRAWNFGDGTSGGGATVSHTYPSGGGTFSVALTVTDNAGATATASRSVTLTAWNLRVSGSKVKGVNSAYLLWNAAATSTLSVSVYRNGSLVKTTPNTGSYTDLAPKGTGSYTYKVCPTGDTRCSNEARVSF